MAEARQDGRRREPRGGRVGHVLADHQPGGRLRQVAVPLREIRRQVGVGRKPGALDGGRARPDLCPATAGSVAFGFDV